MIELKKPSLDDFSNYYNEERARVMFGEAIEYYTKNEGFEFKKYELYAGYEVEINHTGCESRVIQSYLFPELYDRLVINCEDMMREHEESKTGKKEYDGNPIEYKKEF